MLANPQLRTMVGIAAQARFGEQVPVPITQFSPSQRAVSHSSRLPRTTIANIGVNIDITPRVHLDNDVTLTLAVSVTSVSGVGFGGNPDVRQPLDQDAD